MDVKGGKITFMWTEMPLAFRIHKSHWIYKLNFLIEILFVLLFVSKEFMNTLIILKINEMSFFHLKFRCYWSLTIILPNHNNSTQQSQNVSRSWTMETTSSWACVQPRPVWRFAVTLLGGLYSLARDVLRTELLHFYKKGVFHFDKSPPDISLVTSTITAKFML